MLGRCSAGSSGINSRRANGIYPRIRSQPIGARSPASAAAYITKKTDFLMHVIAMRGRERKEHDRQNRRSPVEVMQPSAFHFVRLAGDTSLWANSGLQGDWSHAWPCNGERGAHQPGRDNERPNFSHPRKRPRRSRGGKTNHLASAASGRMTPQFSGFRFWSTIPTTVTDNARVSDIRPSSPGSREIAAWRIIRKVSTTF